MCHVTCAKSLDLHTHLLGITETTHPPLSSSIKTYKRLHRSAKSQIMNNTSLAINISSKNVAPGSSVIVPSKAEGIAWCSAFILTFVLIFVGNMLTIVLFALNKTLRKKSLFLVINMAFADLMLGAVSLPIYIYNQGEFYCLRKTQLHNLSFVIFCRIVVTVFGQASQISAALISCERFYAIYWPLKHRILSLRPYRIVIIMTWTLALVISSVIIGLERLVSTKHAMYAWMPYTFALTFIVCSCNIGIWRKFQQGGVSSQQQNRASQNKRLTKTLLFVSFLVLLSYLPLIIMNYLIFVHGVTIPWRFYYMVIVLNCSNSFVNPIVYALRIPEFRQALSLCCLRRQAAMNTELIKRRNNRAAAMTPMAQLTTSQTEPSHLQLAFEQEVMDTKL